MSRWFALVAWFAMCPVACSKSADKRAPKDAAPDAKAIDAAPPVDAAEIDAAPTVAPPAAIDSKVAQVEIDGRTTCARRADGQVRCWGSAKAEVGSVVPVAIEGAPEAASFDIANGMLAIVTRSGDVAIGPLAVPAQPKLELVSVGEAIDVRIDAHDRAWALTRTGDVHRIDGTTTSKALNNVIALSSREDGSVDALHRDGTVSTITNGKVVPIKGLTDAEVLFGTRCAHRKSGGIACWDARGKSVGWKGPLNTVDRRTSAGVTCTLAGSGVACAGRNDVGQLGTGGSEDRSDARVISLPSKPASIAGSDGAWCAVLESGALACWGANEAGQLGDGTLIDRSTPVLIAGAASTTSPAAVEVPPVAEAADDMIWSDLPKGCTKPTEIPRPGGDPIRVVSAYAVSRAKGTELWFADMKLVQGGYRRGHVVARSSQHAVVYALGGKKIERGRYRGTKGARTATVALASLGAPQPSPADVLVEKVEAGWICGTILDPSDPKQRTSFAALISKPRYE